MAVARRPSAISFRGGADGDGAARSEISERRQVLRDAGRLQQRSIRTTRNAARGDVMGRRLNDLVQGPGLVRSVRTSLVGSSQRDVGFFGREDLLDARFRHAVAPRSPVTHSQADEAVDDATLWRQVDLTFDHG